MQKNDVVFMLDSVQMYVGKLGIVCREAGKLEVMCREQRKTFVHIKQVTRDRPRKRKAVEGRSAAPDFIHEHEAR